MSVLLRQKGEQSERFLGEFMLCKGNYFRAASGKAGCGLLAKCCRLIKLEVEFG